jgi:predicted transcriptional regulator
MAKRRTHVMLEPEAIQYLDSIAEQLERSRSWVMTQIIKKHQLRTKLRTEGVVKNPNEILIK